jgi:hypothetical protein
MVSDADIAAAFDPGEVLPAAEVAERVNAETDGDVLTPQEAHKRLHDVPGVDRYENGQTLAWQRADDDRSDVPCPFGCGYRPENGRDAAKHLLGHAFGSPTPTA